jgi:hypothetical protein
VFFPLYALTMAVSNIMNHRASFDPEYIEPTVEKK